VAATILVPIIDALIPEIPIIEQAIASLIHRGAPTQSVIQQLQNSYNNVVALDADTMATFAKLLPTVSPNSTTASAMKPAGSSVTVG